MSHIRTPDFCFVLIKLELNSALNSSVIVSPSFFNFVIRKASVEAPDINYESIKATRIRLEDTPSCNIGIHFDLVADKIGERF